MSSDVQDIVRVSVEINGSLYERDVEPRLLLSDFIRHEAGLTGTHVGCEHGVCGCCTVMIGGVAVRSCLTLAVQANGAAISTVEGLSREDGLHELQAAFKEMHALQCGYCTPGFLMTIIEFLQERQVASLEEAEIREAISGNLCRCTGYQGIVDAVKLAASRMYEGR